MSVNLQHAVIKANTDNTSSTHYHYFFRAINKKNNLNTLIYKIISCFVSTPIDCLLFAHNKVD